MAQIFQEFSKNYFRIYPEDGKYPHDDPCYSGLSEVPMCNQNFEGDGQEAYQFRLNLKWVRAGARALSSSLIVGSK